MNRTLQFKYNILMLFCVISLKLFAHDAFPPYPLIQGEIIDTTICEGDCIVFENTNYCEAGNYQLGNERVLKVNLMPSVQQLDYIICEGETYPNQEWATAGRYSYQTSVGACEITVWVDLEVKQPKETNINQVIEYGECYDFGPNTLCQTGQYELRYLTSFGCDSTVYINLTVEELLVDTLPSVSICAGETYTPNGIDTVLTSSGMYQFYGTNSDGRETLTILELHVENEIVTQLERTGCEGTPFVYEGQSFEETGVYEFNYTSIKGCDSLILLNLMIGATSITTLTRTITPDAGIVIGNNVVNLEGDYEFIFQSSAGCDSIIQLKLILDGTPDSIFIADGNLAEDACLGVITRNICFKDLPFEFGQNIFWQGGNYHFTYPTPDGCSNDVQLVLNVEQSLTELKETICEGGSYTMNNVEYSESGIYRDTMFAVTENNCDSIIILELTVMLPKDTLVQKSICWGEPFIINGDFITESGEYTQNYLTSNGCDSMVTTALTVEGGPNPDVTPLILCAGENYSDDTGNKVFVSGLYNFRFISSIGCDSIVTLDLLIPDTIRSDVDTFFCEGEVYNFENFAVTRSGSYREIFTSAAGCDSIARYTLTALDCEISSIQGADTIICGGNTGEFSFMLIKGQAPFSYQWESEDGLRTGEGTNLNLQEEVLEIGLPSGIYTVIVTDNIGQEAILEIAIFRPEIITADWELPILKGSSHLACFEDNDAFLEINPSGGLPPYRYAWSNGIDNFNRINNLSAGIFTVTITDDFNCPFIATQQLIEPPPITLQVMNSPPLCEDLTAGMVSVTSITGGTPLYQFSLNGLPEPSTDRTFRNLTAGEYTLSVLDDNGCVIDTTFSIQAPEVLVLDYESEIKIQLGEPIPIEIISSDTPQTIIWEEIGGLSCSDCLNPSANPYESSTYTLTVTSKDDCETTIQLNVVVSKEKNIYIPNVFSPNSDGNNDFFTLYGRPQIANVDVLQIYSRWGELLYESNNMELNNPQKGWDGYFKGQRMNPGVYVWIAKVSFIDNVVETYSGDVTLMK